MMSFQQVNDMQIYVKNDQTYCNSHKTLYFRLCSTLHTFPVAVRKSREIPKSPPPVVTSYPISVQLVYIDELVGILNMYKYLPLDVLKNNNNQPFRLIRSKTRAVVVVIIIWYIFNYLCNQCLSPLKLGVRTRLMAMCTQCSIM